MKPQSTFSPISLRYVAALRGHKPKATTADYAYAEANCVNLEKLICLAASNPEGRFYGFVASEETRRIGEELAARRGIFNVVFLVGGPSSILARLGNGSALPPMLDYLCCDETSSPLSAEEHVALLDLAKKRLNPGGMFVSSYHAYSSADGAMRFLVRELAPEMTAEQKQEFLLELNKLGRTFILQNADIAAALAEAITKGDPDAFFARFKDGPAVSASFDMIVAMRSRGMVYAGDAAVTSNYVELAVPVEAQELVVSCREHVLYEQIKDLALNRDIRSDIWVQPPLATTANLSELFGGFAYGITMDRDRVPPAVAAQGKAIDLSSPLYVKLIELMALLPMGIGDFLAHPTGKGEDPAKIIEALQILVACGIASPMRGNHVVANTGSVAQPRFVGSFNRYLDKTQVTGDDIWVASPVMGCGIEITAREALVMQALNRAGLANSVTALMPELRRLAEDEATKSIVSAEAPSAELAQNMVKEVLNQSLSRWYAYGLLEAA